VKKKDLVSLKTKEIKELEKMAIDKKKASAEAYSKIKAGQEKNIKKVKNLRRDIAQILTVIRQKTLTGEGKEEKEN